MNRVLANTEYFTFEHEVWVRTANGEMHALRETDYDFIREMSEYIHTFYPKAYDALCQEYNGCALNQSYYRYRIVCRFIRCNFPALDNVADINGDLSCNFEYVNCPMRGECRFDHVICRPEFDHQLTRSELRVLELVYEGLTEDAIGDRLRLSPLTVHTHVRNAYARLGIHSKSEFIKYATAHNLFP